MLLLKLDELRLELSILLAQPANFALQSGLRRGWVLRCGFSRHSAELWWRLRCGLASWLLCCCLWFGGRRLLLGWRLGWRLLLERSFDAGDGCWLFFGCFH